MYFIDSLCEIAKFNYLISLMEKTTDEAMLGLTLTSYNYKEAALILMKRYGSKQEIIHNQTHGCSLEFSSKHNLCGLHHLYDLVELQVNILKSFGVESSLSSVLLQKLPLEVSQETSGAD